MLPPTQGENRFESGLRTQDPKERESMDKISIMAGHAETNPTGSLVTGIVCLLVVVVVAAWVYGKLK